MTFFDKMMLGVPYVLGNAGTAPLCVLAAVGFAVLLADKSIRHQLKDAKTLALTLGLVGAWVILVPWAILWYPVDAHLRRRLWWPIIPNWAALLSWPVLAYLLVRRVGERWPTIVYLWCTGIGCVFTWFITVIIVGADPI